jgi:hypothetical protein
MLALRADQYEPLYAASPAVLFIASRELELRIDGAGGRLVMGSFDVPFARVP